MEEMTCAALKENVDKIVEFIDTILTRHNCPQKDVYRLNIAVDEIFSNIANYAYASRGEIGSVTLQLEVTEEPVGVRIRFIDNGVAYNPLNREAPDIHQSAEDRKIGGLGIFMVINMMDEVEYENKGGKNILTIFKLFSAAKAK